MRPALLVGLALLSLATPALADEAKELWGRKCATCHGDDGRGQTKAGRKHQAPDFTDAAWQAKRSDDAILAAIRDGKPETKMKGFGGKLTEPELAALQRTVRAFAKR